MPKRFLFFLLILFFLPSMSHAYDPSDLAKLKETGNCEKCDLSKADFGRTNLTKAGLGRNILTVEDLNEADFGGVVLTEANLTGANLTRAFLTKANLTGANLTGANLTGANLNLANLTEADLFGANLNNAVLGRANLTKAILSRANLNNTYLYYTKMVGTVYEPINVPLVSTMSLVEGLTSLSWTESGSPTSLNLLREAFKKAGMRDQERQVTYAIKHGERLNKGIIERTFQLILFELTCDYGMSPGRPLTILLVLILVFSIGYFFALSLGLPRAGIWRVWPEDRILKDRTLFNPDLPDQVKPKVFGAILWALYFSILSAFHFGWRDLNIGN
jgi:pentapeptide repeat protein